MIFEDFLNFDVFLVNNVLLLFIYFEVSFGVLIEMRRENNKLVFFYMDCMYIFIFDVYFYFFK